MKRIRVLVVEDSDDDARLAMQIRSGYITAELRTTAREAGVRGLLEKEHTFEELCGLVARILEHREPGP